METKSSTRALTKLEARMLGVTPAEAQTLDDVLAGKRVHSQDWRASAGRHFELIGLSRDAVEAILWRLKIGGADTETGNDAPRGGVAGKWIQLRQSGRAKAKRRLA
jgi:hypothetical protein